MTACHTSKHQGNNLANDESNEDGLINKNGRLYKAQNGGDGADDGSNDVSGSANTLKIHHQCQHQRRWSIAMNTFDSILVSSIILLFAMDALLLPALSVYKLRLLRRVFCNRTL